MYAKITAIAKLQLIKQMTKSYLLSPVLSSFQLKMLQAREIQVGYLQMFVVASLLKILNAKKEKERLLKRLAMLNRPFQSYMWMVKVECNI